VEARGLIHIWWDHAGFDDDSLEILSEEEKRRQAAFRFERDRASYVAAHALKRRALSQVASVAPRDWRFHYGPGGKPVIANCLDGSLSFNISHTRGLVACAAAWGFDVGVDVECTDRDVDAVTMRSVLTPSELELVEAGRSSFFDFWTLKEAYLKACGAGLVDHLNRLEIAALTGEWRFFRFQPTARHRLAVVARRF
jgi:4'-phosphopantetheinyl transferase